MIPNLLAYMVLAPTSYIRLDKKGNHVHYGSVCWRWSKQGKPLKGLASRCKVRSGRR